MREDGIGRASIEDTDELETMAAGTLRAVANKIEPWEPSCSPSTTCR